MAFRAVFAGYDKNAYMNLWVTDGTTGGTSELSVSGSYHFGLFDFGVSPGFTVLGKGMLFEGRDSSGQYKLWVTNGTSAGTSELSSVGLFSNYPPDFSVIGSKAVFAGAGAGNRGDLWVTDGTAAGTKDLTAALPTAPLPFDLTVLGNKAVFVGNDPSGRTDSDGDPLLTLWVTDGTAAGTHGLTAGGVSFTGLTPDDPSQQPDFTVMGSKALFAGFDASGRSNLWMTNGTVAGTSELTVADADSSGLFSNLLDDQGPDFTVLGGKALFLGRDAAGHPNLWVTNGTPAGTSEVAVGDADPNGLFSDLLIGQGPDFTVLAGKALFLGTDTAGHPNLWVTDGTSVGTKELIVAGTNSGGLFKDILPQFTVLGGKALFVGTDPTGRSNLWVTDGTGVGTKELAVAGIPGLYPNGLAVVGNKVLFQGLHGGYQATLWVTDGTPGGTHEVSVAGAYTGGGGLIPSDITALPPPPAPPTGLALAPASDSGVKGDRITDVTKPTITGKGVAGDTVILRDGAKVIGSAVVAAGGTWSVTPAAALAAGIYTLTASESSTALGTSAASAPLELTIKISAPAPSGLAFAVAADKGSAGDTFIVAGHGEAGDTVTLYDGAAAIGSAKVAAGGTWSLTTAKPLALGAHSLVARETDVAGNTSLAAPAQSITLKGAAPDNTVVFVGTAGADRFTGGPGNDYFYFTTANLAATDRVMGGDGADNLAVTTAGTVHAAGVGGVEFYWLDKTGTDSLSLTNANFAGLSGSPLSITIEGGNAGNTVNATALTAPDRIVAVGGAGTDNFIGGAGSDIFKFSAANLANTDTVKGGGGTDYLAMTSPGAMHVLGVAGVEVFELSNAAGAADNLALGSANFAGTAGTLWVYGGNPGSVVNAAAAPGAERIVVHAGSAAETAAGGAGNDVFWAGGKTVMTGHGGANLFVFTAPGANTITDFTAPTSPANKIEFLTSSGFSLPGATATAKPLGGLFIQDTAGAFTAATQRFAYGTANGNLYYSATGSTPGEQFVAHLTGDPTLSASQIAHLVFAT